MRVRWAGDSSLPRAMVTRFGGVEVLAFVGVENLLLTKNTSEWFRICRYNTFSHQSSKITSKE
jgi:hypothetical protein